MEHRRKPVPGYEGLYSACSCGHIYSEKRYKRSGKYGGLHPYGGKYVKAFENYDGYLRLHLHKNGTAQNFSVHVLIALSFLGPRKEKYQVNHINSIRTDNRIDNLEYLTAKDNIKHAQEFGNLSNKGENNSRAKLTEKDVAQIKRLLLTSTQQKIAEKFNVSRSTIQHIHSKRVWGHAT